MLIQPFVAWRQTFPFLPAAGQALRSVEHLAAGSGTTQAVADEPARRDGRLAGPLSPLPLPAAPRHTPWPAR